MPTSKTFSTIVYKIPKNNKKIKNIFSCFKRGGEKPNDFTVMRFLACDYLFSLDGRDYMIE